MKGREECGPSKFLVAMLINGMLLMKILSIAGHSGVISFQVIDNLKLKTQRRL